MRRCANCGMHFVSCSVPHITCSGVIWSMLATRLDTNADSHRCNGIWNDVLSTACASYNIQEKRARDPLILLSRKHVSPMRPHTACLRIISPLSSPSWSPVFATWKRLILSTHVAVTSSKKTHIISVVYRSTYFKKHKLSRVPK